MDAGINDLGPEGKSLSGFSKQGFKCGGIYIGSWVVKLITLYSNMIGTFV